MEAFQLLSRGGVKFDKRRFKSSVDLFEDKSHAKTDTKEEDTIETALPAELDFFKYVEGGQHAGPSKRRASSSSNAASQQATKRLKKHEEEEEEGVRPMPRHQVKTKGNNIPAGVSSWEDMQERYDVAPLLVQNLKQFGYKSPTAIQAQGVSILLEGRDLAAISPTGTGKTLSYLISIMAQLKNPISRASEDCGAGVRAIIMAPTRELAHQIYNECNKLGTGRKWRIMQFSKATASLLADKQVRDKVDVIVSTPLRLVAALQSGSIHLNNVRHLVLDEADRLLDSEFLSQTQEIIAACTHPSLQKMVFSATLPAGAERIAMDFMKDPARVVVGLKDTPLPNITQSLKYVADDASKLPTLLAHLTQPYEPPLVIFTSTQPRATSLAEQLILNNIPNVDCLHAGLTRKEREDAVSRMRKGDSWVLVSTEVMARGMDFKGVRSVINFDFPTSVQSYIHRIGRTGRAGREGSAITYFTDEDAPYLKPIANVLLQSGSSVSEWILKLPKPSKMKRRQMGKVKRGEDVSSVVNIGRKQAQKKRILPHSTMNSDMIESSKRRKTKQQASAGRESEKGGQTSVREISSASDNSP